MRFRSLPRLVRDATGEPETGPWAPLPPPLEPTVPSLESRPEQPMPTLAKPTTARLKKTRRTTPTRGVHERFLMPFSVGYQ